MYDYVKYINNLFSPLSASEEIHYYTHCECFYRWVHIEKCPPHSYQSEKDTCANKSQTMCCFKRLRMPKKCLIFNWFCEE